MQNYSCILFLCRIPCLFYWDQARVQRLVSMQLLLNSNFLYSIFSIENLGCLSWTANSERQRQLSCRQGCPKRVPKFRARKGLRILHRSVHSGCSWDLAICGVNLYFSRACSRYCLKRHFKGIYEQNFNRVVIQAMTQLPVRSVALKDCIYSQL